MTAPRISFEYFPPKSDLQRCRFWRAFGALETLGPEYVSITWGAQGADSAASLELLESLAAETRTPLVAHLTCVGQSATALHATLDRLEALGIRRILALRGDQATDEGDDVRDGTFTHATDLVALLQARGGFEVTVSAYPEVHPEATSAASDLDWLCRKSELGASRAITQFFFEPEAFLRLRDALAARAPELTLVPGILPIHDIDGVVRFAEKCGSAVPARLRERFASEPDADARAAIALDEATALCRLLIDEGVDELHVYTLNRALLPGALVTRLGANRESNRGIMGGCLSSAA